MNLPASVLTFLLGVATSGFIFEHLRRRAPKEVAGGGAVLVLLLTLYPLALRMSAASPGPTFAAWGLCSVAGALAAAVAYRLFGSGAGGTGSPD